MCKVRGTEEGPDEKKINVVRWFQYARKREKSRFVLCPLTTLPLWRLVGCRRPPEIKLDVGVFWGDSELLLLTPPIFFAGIVM